MKKVVSVLFVLMFLFNIFPIYINAKEELVRINIITDWSEDSFGVNVLKSNNDFYMYVEDISKITGYKCNVENSNIVFVLGDKYIKINADNNKLTIRNQEYDFSKVITYKDRYYLPISYMLPWMNVNCYVKSGILFVERDPLSFWEVRKDFNFNQFEFNVNEVLGKDANWIVVNMSLFNSILNFKDVLKMVDADFSGDTYYDYETYLEAFKELALDPTVESEEIFDLINDIAKYEKSAGKVFEIIFENINESEAAKDLWSILEDRSVEDVNKETKELFGKISIIKDAVEYANIIGNSTEDYYKTFGYVYNSNQDEHNKSVLRAASKADNLFRKNAVSLGEATVSMLEGILADEIVSGILELEAIGTEIILSNSDKFAQNALKSFGLYTALIDTILTYAWPINKAAEGISQLCVYQNIQNEAIRAYYEYNDNNVEAARLSALLSLKATRKCYEFVAELYACLGTEDIFKYTIKEIDKLIIAFNLTSASQENDSLESKIENTIELKNILDEVKTEEAIEITENDINYIRKSFVNAGKVYSKWRSPTISETDIIESADAVYGAYYAVQENVSTINDMRLEIKEYFTDEACDELIGDHYIERNGKLYYDHWPFGIEDSLYVLNDELTNTDDGLLYKVYFKIVDYEGNSEEDVFEMKIMSDNHKYIFEDYGIFFARLSGEINKLYLKGESYPTNKEINNMAIKTAYKHLTNSLHAYNDQYSEYMIYDMDQDGTTELIYMKGTCMADLKIHYYAYNNGKVEKLGETGGYSIFKTETGKGLYWYYAHMGYETLYRIDKNGNSISEEKIFMNENVPTVEEYSPPDDKYLLETYQYDDYSGIEKYAAYDV